ncbi:MAG: prepilin-type N-terminal cleavage/methylation domain-containing protein [Gammaproteobacteria bacterium]|nr:prepilin-type N-terminal cleavage/methylation domain-containing protein [Gammaproteobacteria bacterium]
MPLMPKSVKGWGRAHRKPAFGLTLVEMLVVFVLLGLVSTLLFQGTGFFASRYETVQRLHRAGSITGLQRHWFISTVQALVPYGREARRFRGDATAFEGISLQPLAAEPGMPAGTRWYISESDGVQTVIYREERGPYAGGVEWPVYTTAEPGLRFQYSDAQGRWRVRWPVDDAPTDWLPHAIRLVTPADGVVWVARVDPSASPVVTEEEIR